MKEDEDPEFIQVGTPCVDPTFIPHDRVAHSPLTAEPPPPPPPKHHNQAVKDIVYAMEIKGGYRNWEWGDALAIKLARLPLSLGQSVWFNGKWWYEHSFLKKPLSAAEEEYLTRRLVGELRWEMVEEEEDRADLISQKLWEAENREDFDFTEWKEKREMSRMNPLQLKRFLKERKRRQQMEQGDDDEYDE
jgi:hypothetical protein